MFSTCQEWGEICPPFPCLPPTTPLAVLHMVDTSILRIVQHRIRQNATNFLTFDHILLKNNFRLIIEVNSSHKFVTAPTGGGVEVEG